MIFLSEVMLLKFIKNALKIDLIACFYILFYLICAIFLLNFTSKEENMAFKKIESKIGFAELALSTG
jgi:hypothetical protein